MSQTPFTDLLNVEERSDMDPRVLATADHLLSTGPLYIPLLRAGYRAPLDSPFISPEILLEEGRYVLHGAGLGSLLLLGREADIHTGRPLWFPEYYLAHRDCRTCSPRWEHLAKRVSRPQARRQPLQPAPWCAAGKPLARFPGSRPTELPHPHRRHLKDHRDQEEMTMKVTPEFHKAMSTWSNALSVATGVLWIVALIAALDGDILPIPVLIAGLVWQIVLALFSLVTISLPVDLDLELEAEHE